MLMEKDKEIFRKQDSELGFRTRGWDRKKIDEFELIFEKLSYEQIEELLNCIGIRFDRSVETIDKSKFCGQLLMTKLLKK